MDKNSRVLWIDYANVIAMVFVVLFHIPSNLLQEVRYIEYIIVNVPFFVFAGMTFYFSYARNRQEGISNLSILQRNAIRLLIPTYFFFFVFYALWVAFGKTMAGDTVPVFLPLEELLTGTPNIVLATYWYIYCLLTIQVLMICLNSVTTNKWVLSLVCILIFVLSRVVDLPRFYGLNTLALFFPFFLAGWFLATNQRVIIAIILFLLLFVSAARVICSGEDITYLVGWVAGIVWCIVLIVCSKIVSRTGIILATVRQLRYGALILLATQNYIIGFIRILSDKYICIDFLSSHYYMKPIILLAVYLINIPIIIIVRKHLPFVMGKSHPSRFGNN